MSKVNINWSSEITKFGWQGLNDAAINTFNSNVINSFVREMFQNSNDARDKDLPVNPKTGKKPPLHISINYKTLKQEQFPNFTEFIDIFKRIKLAEANKQHVEFFKHGEKAMGMRTAIKFFIYEDFNTTGLSGDDNDPNSTFSSCVRSEGTSVKPDDTAGGSYGIGKNAIFGFSKLRTVFYSSLNNKGDYIFQGLAKLASYNDNEGATHVRRIFCGNGKELKSVRDFNELPEKLQEIFQRTAPGLSQYAACPSDNPYWLEEFTVAILRNYWLLILKGDLTVELKENDELKLKIGEENLENLLFEYFNSNEYETDDEVEPAGNPYEFYKCFVEGKCTERVVDILGKVKFYYKELDNDTTDRVAYLRNGMVVYSQSIHGFSSINYSGVFICDNDDGNRVLRLMEPPTHDSFNPERLDGRSEEYSSSDGKKILNNVKNLIKESLQEIADKYKQPAEDIPWLDDLLSSISGAAGAGTGNRMNVKSEKETPERIGADIKTSIQFKSLQKDSLVNYNLGNEEGTGGGRRGGKNSGQKPGPGPNRGEQKTKKTKIKSRVFKTGNSKNIQGEENWEYSVYLNSETRIPPSDILISQKGDTGNVVSFQLSEVTDIHGGRINFYNETNREGDTTAFRIKAVQIPSELKLYLKEPYKSSFRIINS